MKVPANAIQHYWNTTSPLIQNAPSLSDCRSNEISCIHTCSPAVYGTAYESYVYWTVHHLDGWINRDQLDVTCFFISLFNAQHVSDVNTSILRSLRLVCWVISWVVLLWYDVCWCYVVVWLGRCGIRMQASAWIKNTSCCLYKLTVCNKDFYLSNWDPETNSTT